MTRFANIARVAITRAILVATLGVTGAEAQNLYPRSLSDGENSVIEFGPNGNRNATVGGGRVEVTGSGEDAQTRHLDAQYVQQPPIGYRQIWVGSGESMTMVWVPEGLSQTELALVGQDGSLPRSVNMFGGVFARGRAAR